MDTLRKDLIDLNTVKSLLINWAKDRSFILKIYIFGSRVTGVSKKTGQLVRPDSDLDIAIDFGTLYNDENLITTWTAEFKGWRKELSAIFGFSDEHYLHLHWYHQVVKYLDVDSLLAYP